MRNMPFWRLRFFLPARKEMCIESDVIVIAPAARRPHRSAYRDAMVTDARKGLSMKERSY